MAHRLLKESIAILKSTNNPRSEQDIAFLTSQLKNFDYFDVIKYNLDFETKLKACAKLLCYQHFKAGETIFLKGSKELNFYLIFAGNISVVVDKTPEELEAEIQSRQLLEQANQDYQKGNLVMQEIAKKTITRINAELKYKYQIDQQKSLLSLNNPDILKSCGECGVLSLKQINILSHYKSFGELSMTTNQNRTASVFALTEVDLAFIKESDYRHLFKEQIDIGLFMVDTMSLLLGQDAERSEVGEFSYYFKTTQIPYKKAFYNEGDEAKHMYLIKQGQVELKITGPNKKELPLSILGVGQFFGHEQGVEMGLFRTCSAICGTNDTVVCEVDIEQVIQPMFTKFAAIFSNQAAQSQRWIKKRKNMIISSQKIKPQSSQRALEQKKKQEEQQQQEQQQQKESIKNSNEFLLAMIKMRDSERLLKQSFNSSSGLDKSPHKAHLQKQFSMVLDEQSLDSLSPRKSTKSTFRKSQLKSMDELITELNIQKDQQSQIYPTTTTGFCVSMNLSSPKLKSSLSCSPRKLKLRLHKESDISPNELRENNQVKEINESTTNESGRNMSQVDFSNAIQSFENRNGKTSNEVNVSFSKQTSEHISEINGEYQLQKPKEPQETRAFSPFKIHNIHRKAESMIVFSQLPKNPSNKSLLKEQRNQQIQVTKSTVQQPQEGQINDLSMNSPTLNMNLNNKTSNNDSNCSIPKNTINNVTICDFASINCNVPHPIHVDRQYSQKDSSSNAEKNNSITSVVISNVKDLQNQGCNDTNPIIYVSQMKRNHSKTLSSQSPLKVLTAFSSLKTQQQQQQLHSLSPSFTPPPLQQTIPSAQRKFDTIRMNASQSLKIQIQRLAEKKRYPKETNGIVRQIEARIEAISGQNSTLPCLSPYLKRTLKLDTEESTDCTIKNPSQSRLSDLSTRKKDSLDLSNNQQLIPQENPLQSPQLSSDNQTSRLSQPSLSQHQQARQQSFMNLKHIDENKAETMRIHHSLLMKKKKIRNISDTMHSINTDPVSSLVQPITKESEKLKLDDVSPHLGASAVNSFQLKHFFPRREESEKKKISSSGFQTEFFCSQAKIKHSSQIQLHFDAMNETIVEGHSFSSELLQPKGEDSFQAKLAKAIRKKQQQLEIEDGCSQQYQQQEQQSLSSSQLKQLNLDKKPLNPQVFSLKKIPMSTPSKRAKIFQQTQRQPQEQQPNGLLSVSTLKLPAQQQQRLLTNSTEQ